MKFTNTIRNVIFATLFVFGAFGIAGGAMYLTEEANGARDSLLLARAQARAEQVGMAALTQLTLQTEPSRTELASYILQNDDEAIDFVGALELQARRLGLEVKTQSLATTDIKKSIFSEVSVTLEVKGELESVRGLFRLIEHMPYQIRLNDIRLVRNDGAWTGTATILITKKQ